MLRILRSLVRLPKLIFNLIPALARFSFVDGRRYIRFPNGAVRRAGPKAHELRKTERKALRRHAQEQTEKEVKTKKASHETAHWEKQMHALRERDLDRRVSSE